MCTGVEIALIAGSLASTAATAVSSQSKGPNAPTLPTVPDKANKKNADSNIAKSINRNKQSGSTISKSPTLLSGSGGIQDSALNLGGIGKSLIGG